MEFLRPPSDTENENSSVSVMNNCKIKKIYEHIQRDYCMDNSSAVCLQMSIKKEPKWGSLARGNFYLNLAY